MLSNDKLRVSIRTKDDKRIPLASFAKVVERVDAMLETVERELGLGYATPGFELASMHSSVPTIYVAHAGNEPKHEVFEATIDAVDAASTENWSAWPQNMTSPECVDAVRDAVKSALVVGDGLDFGFNSRSANADRSASLAIEQWSNERNEANRAIPGWGRVEGKLDSISVHSRMVFNVWRDSDGRRFECDLDESQFETARGLLRKTVGVDGLVTELAKGRSSKISQVATIEEIETDSSINTASLFGSIPDLWGDLTPDQYWGIVRGNRSYGG